MKKRFNNGFIGIVIAVIIAVLVGISGTYIVLDKNRTPSSGSNFESINQEHDANTLQTKNGDTDRSTNAQTNMKIANSNVIPETLTDDEILAATYKISANFGGKRTMPQNITFPSPITEHSLTGQVYISQNGEVTKDPSGFTGEAFRISGYKYTDSSRTEAKVIISGNFGGSGFDDRAYIVNKIKGVVYTKETTCNKAPNGSCGIDTN